VQIAFILIGENEELINYYQEISNLLTPYYRCQLYNKNKQVNLNILQADKEGCPFKIILGKDEFKKNEITLVRRDNIERKITINLKESEKEEKYISAFEKYMEELSKIEDNPEIKKELTKEKVVNSFKRGERAGKMFRVIEKEKEEFKKNLYQKSADFRDSHIFLVDDFSELEKKIKEGIKGLFLVPFCNNLECEETIKRKAPSYSIRCIALEKKIIEPQQCLFCQFPARYIVYLGRSY